MPVEPTPPEVVIAGVLVMIYGAVAWMLLMVSKHPWYLCLGWPVLVWRKNRD